MYGPDAQLHEMGEFVLAQFSEEHQLMIRTMVRQNAIAINLLDDPEEAMQVPEGPDQVSTIGCMMMLDLIQYEGFQSFTSVVVPALDLRIDYEKFHELKLAVTVATSQGSHGTSRYRDKKRSVRSQRSPSPKRLKKSRSTKVSDTP